MKFPEFPMRQVHLDFHTSPDIPDVGADWDADLFIHTLTEARVNSITVFAKCHHGMNYYPTKIGPVHPALKFDLLGEQVEACHRAGIRCPIYVSVGWDESAAARHPEWRQLAADGKLVGAGPLEPGWKLMCVNNTYSDELIAQTEELMSLYDCDGFFYDILTYSPTGCICSNCLAEFRREGLDPSNAAHRRAHNNLVARRFMERMSSAIRAKLPDGGIFYNSRWGVIFQDESQYYSQVEIESLPTGGWGYGFYPLWSRYGRNFGLPMLGMTGRFHRTWADWGGLKHPDALRFECGGILATGGAISVGDQMHPRGRLNKAVYKVIGEAFRDVEAVEKYCIGAQAVAEVALLILDADLDRAQDGSNGGPIQGAAKVLLELHAQFDVITPRQGDFGKYKVLIVADRGSATPEIAQRLKQYVAQGGKLLLTHEATLDAQRGNFALADEMGVDYVGAASSVPDYFQITDSALQGPVTQPDFPYSFYDGPSVRVAPRAGTVVMADAYESYFNRTAEHFSSHGFTAPKAEKAGYPAVTRNGNVIYIYGPVFKAYQNYGNLTFRALIGKCLDLLLQDPVLQTDAPPTAEVTLMQQKDRQIVHIVNYHADRRAPAHVEVLETPVPLTNVSLRVRRTVPADHVFLARTGTPLPFTQDDETISVIVPRVEAYEAVVLDTE